MELGAVSCAQGSLEGQSVLAYAVSDGVVICGRTTLRFLQLIDVGDEVSGLAWGTAGTLAISFGRGVCLYTIMQSAMEKYSDQEGLSSPRCLWFPSLILRTPEPAVSVTWLPAEMGLVIATQKSIYMFRCTSTLDKMPSVFGKWTRQEVDRHHLPLCAIAASPDGSFIAASASMCSLVRVYSIFDSNDDLPKSDRDIGRTPFSYLQHTSVVLSFEWAEIHGVRNHIVTCARDGFLHIWMEADSTSAGSAPSTQFFHAGSVRLGSPMSLPASFCWVKHEGNSYDPSLLISRGRGDMGASRSNPMAGIGKAFLPSGMSREAAFFAQMDPSGIPGDSAERLFISFADGRIGVLALFGLQSSVLTAIRFEWLAIGHIPCCLPCSEGCAAAETASTRYKRMSLNCFASYSPCVERGIEISAVLHGCTCAVPGPRSHVAPGSKLVPFGRSFVALRLDLPVDDPCAPPSKNPKSLSVLVEPFCAPLVRPVCEPLSPPVGSRALPAPTILLPSGEVSTEVPASAGGVAVRSFVAGSLGPLLSTEQHSTLPLVAALVKDSGELLLYALRPPAVSWSPPTATAVCSLGPGYASVAWDPGLNPGTDSLPLLYAVDAGGNVHIYYVHIPVDIDENTDNHHLFATPVAGRGVSGVCVEPVPINGPVQLCPTGGIVTSSDSDSSDRPNTQGDSKRQPFLLSLCAVHVQFKEEANDGASDAWSEYSDYDDGFVTAEPDGGVDAKSARSGGCSERAVALVATFEGSSTPSCVLVRISVQDRFAEASSAEDLHSRICAESLGSAAFPLSDETASAAGLSGDMEGFASEKLPVESGSQVVVAPGFVSPLNNSQSVFIGTSDGRLQLAVLKRNDGTFSGLAEGSNDGPTTWIWETKLETVVGRGSIEAIITDLTGGRVALVCEDISHGTCVSVWEVRSKGWSLSEEALFYEMLEESPLKRTSLHMPAVTDVERVQSRPGVCWVQIVNVSKPMLAVRWNARGVYLYGSKLVHSVGIDGGEWERISVIPLPRAPGGSSLVASTAAGYLAVSWGSTLVGVAHFLRGGRHLTLPAEAEPSVGKPLRSVLESRPSDGSLDEDGGDIDGGLNFHEDAERTRVSGNSEAPALERNSLPSIAWQSLDSLYEGEASHVLYHPDTLWQLVAAGRLASVCGIMRRLSESPADDNGSTKAYLTGFTSLGSLVDDLRTDDETTDALHGTAAPEATATAATTGDRASGLFDEPNAGLDFFSMDRNAHQDETQTITEAARSESPQPHEESGAADAAGSNWLSTDAAEKLTDKLSSQRLPALDGVAQLQVMAFVDIFRDAEMMSVLDECGLRYAVVSKMTKQARTRHPDAVISDFDALWGLFSSSQQQLLDGVLGKQGAMCNWKDVRAMRVPLWVSSVAALRSVAEKVAQSHYRVNREPDGECSMLYLALKKRTALLQLYRAGGSHKIVNFLGNDFTVDRWKQAACKNAFVLLAKHQYQLAIGFYFLAEQVSEAVSVALRQLNDPVLAYFLVRIWEGGEEPGPVARATVQDLILPYTQTHHLHAIRAALLWRLGKYADAAAVVASSIVDQAAWPAVAPPGGIDGNCSGGAGPAEDATDADDKSAAVSMGHTPAALLQRTTSASPVLGGKNIFRTLAAEASQRMASPCVSEGGNQAVAGYERRLPPRAATTVASEIDAYSLAATAKVATIQDSASHSSCPSVGHLFFHMLSLPELHSSKGKDARLRQSVRRRVLWRMATAYACRGHFVLALDCLLALASKDGAPDDACGLGGRLGVLTRACAKEKAGSMFRLRLGGSLSDGLAEDANTEVASQLEAVALSSTRRGVFMRWLSSVLLVWQRHTMCAKTKTADDPFSASVVSSITSLCTYYSEDAEAVVSALSRFCILTVHPVFVRAVAAAAVGGNNFLISSSTPATANTLGRLEESDSTDHQNPGVGGLNDFVRRHKIPREASAARWDAWWLLARAVRLAAMTSWGGSELIDTLMGLSGARALFRAGGIDANHSAEWDEDLDHPPAASGRSTPNVAHATHGHSSFASPPASDRLSVTVSALTPGSVTPGKSLSLWGPGATWAELSLDFVVAVVRRDMPSLCSLLQHINAVALSSAPCSAPASPRGSTSINAGAGVVTMALTPSLGVSDSNVDSNPDARRRTRFAKLGVIARRMTRRKTGMASQIANLDKSPESSAPRSSCVLGRVDTGRVAEKLAVSAPPSVTTPAVALTALVACLHATAVAAGADGSTTIAGSISTLAGARVKGPAGELEGTQLRAIVEAMEEWRDAAWLRWRAVVIERANQRLLRRIKIAEKKRERRRQGGSTPVYEKEREERLWENECEWDSNTLATWYRRLLDMAVTALGGCAPLATFKAELRDAGMWASGWGRDDLPDLVAQLSEGPSGYGARRKSSLSSVLSAAIPQQESSYGRKGLTYDATSDLYRAPGELLRGFCFPHASQANDDTPVDARLSRPAVVASSRDVREVRLGRLLWPPYGLADGEPRRCLDDDDAPSQSLPARSSRAYPSASGAPADGVEGQGLAASLFNPFRRLTRVKTCSHEPDLVREKQVAYSMDAHPVLPMYASGDGTGGTWLWHYGVEKEVASWSRSEVSVPGVPKAVHPRICRVRFTPLGDGLAASDQTGVISLWRQDASGLSPSSSGAECILAHDGKTDDFCFYNATGSVVVAAGVDASDRNVCVYDLGVGMRGRRVMSLRCHAPAGACAVLAIPEFNFLVSGGRAGDLRITDLRMVGSHKWPSVLEIPPATDVASAGHDKHSRRGDHDAPTCTLPLTGHSLAVKSLVFDPAASVFCSGSSDGSVLVWDCRSLQLLQRVPNAHEKQSFLFSSARGVDMLSSYGVLQLQADDGVLYSCGANGRLSLLWNESYL